MPWCKVKFTTDDYLSYKAGQTDEVYVTQADAIVRHKFGEVVEGPYLKDGEPAPDAQPEALNLNPERRAEEIVAEADAKATEAPKADKALQARKHRPAAITTADVRGK